MKRLILVSLILAAACGDSATSPSAIAGTYSVASFNGVTALPVPFDTVDGLVFRLSDGTLSLNADGSYQYGQVVSYERISTGISYVLVRSSAGQFALHGSVIEFTATTGTPPTRGDVTASGVRLLQSVEDGRSPDTLVFKRQP